MFVIDFGLINFIIVVMYDNGVCLKWVLFFICYERIMIIVKLLFINGWFLIWIVDKNVDWFDLIGLDLEMNYNLLLIMNYGS